MTDGVVAVAALAAVVAIAAVGVLLAWPAERHDRLPTDPTTPLRFAILAYAALHLAGSVVLILAGESRGMGPLLAAGAMAALGGGALLAGRALRPTPAMPKPRAGGLSRIGVAVLAAVGLACVGYLVARNGLPLLAADPQASRAGFGGLVFDAFRWLVPPAALAAFAQGVASGERRRLGIGAVAVAAVAGLEVMLASRALPFELAIGALLIAWWAGHRPRPAVWAGLAAVGLVVFVGVQLIRVGPDGGFSGAADAAGFAVRRTVDRVLLIHPRTLELVATRIPSEEPFFAGSTYIRRLAPVLGDPERPTLGYWIYERLFPSQPGGFAAPGVAGEAWANGGPLLVVGLMAALGALARWLGLAVARLPGGPADLTLAALVVVAMARTYATSLNGFLLTIVAAFAWWLVASGRLARIRRGQTGSI